MHLVPIMPRFTIRILGHRVVLRRNEPASKIFRRVFSDFLLADLSDLCDSRGVCFSAD